MHQAIKPQYQARNDFDIFADIADRLGYRDRFTEGRNEMQLMQCAVVHARRGIPFPEFGELWQRDYVEILAGGKLYVFYGWFPRRPGSAPDSNRQRQEDLRAQITANPKKCFLYLGRKIELGIAKDIAEPHLKGISSVYDDRQPLLPDE